MMKRIGFLCWLLAGCLMSLAAFNGRVNGCDQRLSPEEFKAKQRLFIIEQVGLTDREAARFFPVYYELQEAKKKLHDEAWNWIRKGREEKVSEQEYERILKKVNENRLAGDRLDQEYLEKFHRILSWKKIYQVQRAEIHFHRLMLRGMNHHGKKGPKSTQHP